MPTLPHRYMMQTEARPTIHNTVPPPPTHLPPSPLPPPPNEQKTCVQNAVSARDGAGGGGEGRCAERVPLCHRGKFLTRCFVGTANQTRVRLRIYPPARAIPAKGRCQWRARVRPHHQENYGEGPTGRRHVAVRTRPVKYSSGTHIALCCVPSWLKTKRWGHGWGSMQHSTAQVRLMPRCGFSRHPPGSWLIILFFCFNPPID